MRIPHKPTMPYRREQWQSLLFYALAAILTIGNFYSILIAGQLPLGLIFGLVAMFPRFYIASQVNLNAKLTQAITWLYYDGSLLSIYAILSLDDRNIVYRDSYTQLILVLGVLVLCGHALAMGFLGRQFEPRQIPRWGNAALPKAKVLLYSSFAGALFVQFLSWKLGIAEMGGYRDNFVRLPFGLNGVLDSYRKMAIPFLTIIFLDIFYEKKVRSYQYFTFLFYTIFLLVEVKIRLSKGIFFVGFLPILSWLCIRQLFKLKHVLLICAALLPFIIIYPYLNLLRTLNHTQVTENADISTYMHQYDSLLDQGLVGFVAAYSRMHGDAIRLTTSYDSLEGSLFHNNVGLCAAYGGVSKFYTLGVLGATTERGFSAGTTLLAEGYIVFGVLGMMGLLCLFLVVQIYIDHRSLPLICYNLPACAFSAYYFYRYLSGGFLQAMFKIEYFLPLIALYLFNRYLHKSSFEK